MLFSFFLLFLFRSLIHSQYFLIFSFFQAFQNPFSTLSSLNMLTLYTHHSIATVFRKWDLARRLIQSRHDLFSPSSSSFLPYTSCVMSYSTRRKDSRWGRRVWVCCFKLNHSNSVYYTVPTHITDTFLDNAHVYESWGWEPSRSVCSSWRMYESPSLL